MKINIIKLKAFLILVLQSTFVFIIFSYKLLGNQFFVSAEALASGLGTYNSPWKLQTALNHPKTLQPGDTVWIRGGTYLNNFDSQTSFNCNTNGTATSPIIFRNYKQERVILDGENTYTLYAAINNCSYTWFWGLEITNSYSKDRKHDISGGVTCTASEMKFINMIIHDTGSGLDLWKTAKNTEAYGNIIYHIGNNVLNNMNWEGHGHGMYLQNDTFGLKKIHQNIIFSSFGYGMKVWQTTTTSALGHFDIRDNILFNGGSASENLGGVGNNYRTHNFFIVSNSVGNPVLRSSIVHNFTYSGTNTPRPPVNAFGLNYGMNNCRIDSNVLTGQTRLGFNNTPVFKSSVSSNKIISGIPSVYGYYLWGFSNTDFPQNDYIDNLQSQTNEYYLLNNQYENNRNHLVIYNWQNQDIININLIKQGWKASDEYILINVLDLHNDTIRGKLNSFGEIEIPMQNRSLIKAIGADKEPVSQFPGFGTFILIRSPNILNVNYERLQPQIKLFPNPCHNKLVLHTDHKLIRIEFYTLQGNMLLKFDNFTNKSISSEFDVSLLSSGIYWVKVVSENGLSWKEMVIE